MCYSSIYVQCRRACYIHFNCKRPNDKEFQEGLGKKKCIILFKNLECTIWPVFPVIKKINI